MRETEIVNKEVQEEITNCVKCDNCEKVIEYADSCGYGQAFILHLNDAWCSGCSGKSWDFCSLKCLREFVVHNELDEPRKLEENIQK